MTAMYNSILSRLWYRAVEWWMHRHGAEDIEVEYMDKTFTVPVYPLTWDQQLRLRRATNALEDRPGLAQERQVFHALTEVQTIAEEVTEYKVDDFPTELIIQILTEAPKEGLRS